MVLDSPLWHFPEKKIILNWQASKFSKRLVQTVFIVYLSVQRESGINHMMLFFWRILYVPVQSKDDLAAKVYISSWILFLSVRNSTYLNIYLVWSIGIIYWHNFVYWTQLTEAQIELFLSGHSSGLVKICSTRAFVWLCSIWISSLNYCHVKHYQNLCLTN